MKVEGDSSDFEKVAEAVRRNRREISKLSAQLKNKEVTETARNDVIRRLAELDVEQTKIGIWANLNQSTVSRIIAGRVKGGKPGPKGPITQHEKALRALGKTLRPPHPHATLRRLRQLSGSVVVVIPPQILSVCGFGVGDYVWVEPEGRESVRVRKAIIK